VKNFRSFLLGAMTCFIVFAAACYASPSSAQTWTLTQEQRRSYLYYYAPVIFKRGNENNGKRGYDWGTNFHFDQDGTFSNNLNNSTLFPNLISAASAGHSSYASWRLRPTLYTALLEFSDSGKNLVLIYHIYHGHDNAEGIHDWERTELHLKNVVGSPGSGELVSHVVVTQHHRHVVRTGTQVNFMQTPTGKHVMLWQAEWSDKAFAAHGRELRFVQDSHAYLKSRWQIWNAKAEVDVNNDSGHKNVHYAFVPDQSAGAVAELYARPLTYTTAESLSSGLDNGTTTTWSNVKRITYELQDLADILPTHWQYGNYAGNWRTTESLMMVLDSNGITNEMGALEVPAGLQTFYTQSALPNGGGDGRTGYPDKPWLWGTYNMNDNASDNSISPGGSNFTAAAFAGNVPDSRGNTRTSANGRPLSANIFWWQHDYFAHFGYTDNSSSSDPGFWLTGDWHLPTNGGFDGRWVQLFDDRAGQELYAPLSVSMGFPVDYCTNAQYGNYQMAMQVDVSGGMSPYTVAWSSDYSGSWQSGAPHSFAYLDPWSQYTLTVTSADGQSQSYPYYFEPWCYYY
jgi:hypothetical protein